MPPRSDRHGTMGLAGERAGKSGSWKRIRGLLEETITGIRKRRRDMRPPPALRSITMLSAASYLWNAQGFTPGNAGRRTPT